MHDNIDYKSLNNLGIKCSFIQYKVISQVSFSIFITYVCFNLILNYIVWLSLVKPIAMTNCSTNVTVKEGDDLECLCYDTRGNPSPRVLWYKDGKNIGEPKFKEDLVVQEYLDRRCWEL